MQKKALVISILLLAHYCYAEGKAPLSSDVLLDNNSHSYSVQSQDYNHINPIKLIRIGVGKNNVLQGISLDINNNYLYSLNVTGKTEKGVINKFIYDDNKTLEAKVAQSPSGLIGHQGITVNPHNGNLLSSAGTAVENKGWYIVNFKFKPNAQPADTAVIKAFGKGYSNSSSGMPVITPDANHLIIRGKLKGRNIIRIWKLSDIHFANGEDISQSFIDEWPISQKLTNNKYDLQAITSDNNYIYLFSGRADQSNKIIYVYTLKGKLIQQFDNVTLGLSDSINSGNEQHWEPEGLTYDPREKKLLVLFATGNKGKRLGIIYKVPAR